MVTTRVGASHAISSCARSFTATAAPLCARTYDRGCARLRPLLASTSLAALLIGVGSPAAFAVDCTPQIAAGTTVDNVVNSVPNPSCIIAGVTVTHNVTNTSSITSGPISISNNSSIGGAVVNEGAISSPGAANGINIDTAVVSGGVDNSGTISTGFKGIELANINTFGGGITNSGTITVAQIGIELTGVQTFAGGITNFGRIVNTAATAAINIQFSGFVAGGITNSGTITAPAQNGIQLRNVQTFAGSISNSGTIMAGSAGVFIGSPGNGGVGTFEGGVTNTGGIVARTGILVQAGGGLGGAIQGGITNTGDITGTVAAINLINEGAATTINQEGGTITGPIRLSLLGDTVNVTGGTINGNIQGPAPATPSGTVNFNLGAGNTFTYASNFSNVDRVNVNSGTVVLTGDNNTSATNIIPGATLQLGNGGPNGSSVGSLTQSCAQAQP